jgi:hypothetical protein
MTKAQYSSKLCHNFLLQSEHETNPWRSLQAECLLNREDIDDALADIGSSVEYENQIP